MINSFADRLIAEGFTRTLVYEYHFFKPATDKTTLIVNLKNTDDGIRIVYGVSSTAFTAMNGDEDALLRLGVSDDDCTLRRMLLVTPDDDSGAAGRTIAGFLDEYMHLQKDELLAAAKEKRKQYINKMAVRLKPLEFKKKGNSWHRAIGDSFMLDFDMQKSSYSDVYYFNVSYKSDMNKGVLPCFYNRVRFDDEYTFDWQLMSEAKTDELMEHVVREYLMPILEADEAGLIEMARSNKCLGKADVCAECIAKMGING